MHPGIPLMWVAISCTGLPRIGCKTCGCVALGAHDTKPTTNVCGHGHTISLLHIGHRRTGLLHDAQWLVTDHLAFKAAHAPLVKMQVGPTDRG